jgi:fatty acid desaturase
MTTPQSSKAADASPVRDLRHAARYYFGNRTALAILAIVAIAAGLALNWSWLVAAGIAPVLLTALPCLVMCGLGLCMNKMAGRSCALGSAQSTSGEIKQTQSDERN